MLMLKERYKNEIVPKLKDDLALGNVMQVPKLEKIVLNMGLGSATKNPRIVEEAVDTLTAITGQKAVTTRAKKAISNFKLRENIAIGAKVTLHGDKMWEFLERFINVSLPRTRDFRGISRKGFDGRGNYTMGVKEQTIFTEIDYDKVNNTLGMDISLVTSAENDEQGRALLTELGLPFRK
ncbi:MAG: 50S ribosomal protein L5 [Fibrobacterales bacterium]